MVREADHSGGVSLSSIALLQERFRRLQKMKELRQEKQLLRTLPEPDRCSPPATIPLERQPTTFSGSDQQMFPPPPSPHCQLSLSLWPDSERKHADSPGINAPSSNILAKSSSTDSARQFAFTEPPFKIESSDVEIDTSLRL